MHKIFGVKENENYTDRIGAYLIPIKDNKVALVQTAKGYFLIGGGLNENEDDIEAINRECLEEIGYAVEISEQICSAEAYCINSKIGYFHPIQRYYSGKLINRITVPIESDHKLVWLSINDIQGKMFSQMQEWAVYHTYFKNVKWLFFDVGSTLVDESKCIEERCKIITSENGIDEKDFYSKVFEYAKTDAHPVKPAARDYGAAIPPWNKELEFLFPYAESVLAELSKSYKLGIIANQSFGTKERLDNWGIGKYFDVVISSAEEGCEKPDLKIFELAIKRAGCKAEETVMIGDRLDNDIVPANKIGMKTVWVRQGFAKYQSIKDESEQPTCTINSLNNLLF